MSTTITAKFRCVAKTERETWSGDGTVSYGISLAAATGPGNESWSKATPNGSIELTVTNATAVDGFIVGREYLMTFDLVPVKSAQPGVAA